MSFPEISIPHEAVRKFIKRFNNRGVFSDSSVNCPNILQPKSEIGGKIAALIKIKHIDRNDLINIDSDDFINIGISDLKILLKLCYIEFSLNTNEKLHQNTFDHITKIYKEMLTLIDTS